MWRSRIPVLLAVLLLLNGIGMPATAAYIVPPVVKEVPRVPAPGVFLVASRAVNDPYFSATVVYLLQHDEHGSLGIIVNHPVPVSLGDWIPKFENTTLAAQPLYYGGPLYPDYLTILLEHWPPRDGDDPERVFRVTDGLFASLDPSILDEVQEGKADRSYRLRCYFGHVGWYAGQLDKEVQQHYWHLLPGDVDAVMGEDSGSLWRRLIERVEPTDLLTPLGLSQAGRMQ